MPKRQSHLGNPGWYVVWDDGCGETGQVRCGEGVEGHRAARREVERRQEATRRGALRAAIAGLGILLVGAVAGGLAVLLWPRGSSTPTSTSGPQPPSPLASPAALPPPPLPPAQPARPEVAERFDPNDFDATVWWLAQESQIYEERLQAREEAMKKGELHPPEAEEWEEFYARLNRTLVGEVRWFVPVEFPLQPGQRVLATPDPRGEEGSPLRARWLRSDLPRDKLNVVTVVFLPEGRDCIPIGNAEEQASAKKYRPGYYGKQPIRGRLRGVRFGGNLGFEGDYQLLIEGGRIAVD
jgi:hypothetical protein